jgi:uncharacterized protein YjbI with pentapeptide repeats
MLCFLPPQCLSLWHAYSDLGQIGQGIYVEAWGTVFDILVVGIILTIFTINRDRREKINRYLDEIDDFKKWDNEEARLRIAGNIRRLAKLGKTDIDLSGIVLRNFSFGDQDIGSLRGSIFSHGLTFATSKNNTCLENVDFLGVDCSGVVFSRNTGEFAGLGLVGKNLGFINANLNGACFNGAKLAWTDYKANEDDWHVDHGWDDHGAPIIQRVYYPAFSEADLKGCSFRYAELDHADFREARNLLEVDFTGAKGLETCFFDDKMRERILAAAAKKSNSL